jgi:hypothetical protein
LDGKTLRRSRDESGDAVASLAAFARTVGVAVGQQSVSDNDQVQAAL